MPIEKERRYQAWARSHVHTKRGPNGKVYGSVQQHRNAVVYGRMRHEGWKPQREKR